MRISAPPGMSIPILYALWMILGTAMATTGFFDDSENQALTPPYKVETVAGSVVKLPCYIPLLPTGDKVHTVIWYKEGSPLNKHSPIYTYDVRGRSLNDGIHFADSVVFGDRANFRYEEKPPKLIIADVRESDGGVYNCRVDYKSSPTGNFRVNLTVLTPPERLVILDEKQHQLDRYILGPYNEGESMNTTCVAVGGNPPPKLTWWLENTLVDNFAEYNSKGRVKNTLYLYTLERKHHSMVLTCQASSGNGTVPISTSATLELNLKPLSIQLFGKQKSVTAKIEHDLSCEVKGSKPPPNISWWKDATELLATKQITSTDDNTTTSYLTILPLMEDHGRKITCKATHPIISDAIIEDSWTMEVHNVPYVTLSLGAELDGNNIVEGRDIYLECNIEARPPHYSLMWKFNGVNLQHNNFDGIIIANQTLVVQNVTRGKNGAYTCTAKNDEGYGESNNVEIDIKYLPVCKTNQTKTYRTSIFEAVELKCELDANPTLVDFTWKLAAADGKMTELPANFINSSGTSSSLFYTPTSDRDFLAIFCLGKNSVGMQVEPCEFHIKPIGTPEPPSECKVLRQARTTLFVQCAPNHEQTADQHFEIEVVNEDGELIATRTSDHSIFTVDELDPGAGYDLVIYTKNKQGRSVPSKLQTFTLEHSEDYGVLPADTMRVVLMLFGAVAGIILVAIAIVIMVRLSDEDDEDSEGLRSSGEFLHLSGETRSNAGHSHRSIDSIAAYSSK